MRKYYAIYERSVDRTPCCFVVFGKDLLDATRKAQELSKVFGIELLVVGNVMPRDEEIEETFDVWSN